MINRYFVIITCIFALISSANSQEVATTDTVITPNMPHGGFAGPVFRYVSLGGQSGMMIGGHAAFMINKHYGIGLGSYGLSSNVKVSNRDTSFDLYTGTIGLELHYLNNSGKLMHWMGTVFMGRAELQLDRSEVNTTPKSMTDVYFLLLPSVQYELNITPVLMVNAGVGYNMAIGVDDGLAVTGKDMSGLTISASVVIGWF